MSRSRTDGAAPAWQVARVAATRDEEGFTLIELIVVTAIIPIIVGAMAAALMMIFSTTGGIGNRTNDAADAQAVASFYEHDVHGAALITTSSAASQCGPGTQLLGMESNYNTGTGTYQTVISYVSLKVGSVYHLVRQYCSAGVSATPTLSTTISSDISASQAPPTVTPNTLNPSPSTGWVSSIGVTGVSFTITQPLSSYTYTLYATPQAGSSSNQQSNVTPQTSTCGFASPGTGTYASKLCFVDFTPFASLASPNGATSGSNYNQPPTGCTTVTAGIVNTPYRLSFCLSVQSNPASGSPSGSGTVFSDCTSENPAHGVLPSPIPTYYDSLSSEAFLGNNGFYQNIPGNPALYQCANGVTTTATLTAIKVLDSNGNAASGWQLVTGDAESTDSGESISWTSNQNLALLPNSPTSQIGNACSYTTQPSGVWFTGVGTTTVTCQANVSSNKTGTVMLEAPAPTQLSATMVGGGLQAIFIGVLLP